MAVTKNMVSEWRGFGSSTAIFAVVIAVIGSAVDRMPLISILGAFTAWVIVNSCYFLFVAVFKK